MRLKNGVVWGGGPAPGGELPGGVRLLGSAGGQRLPVGPIPLFNRNFLKRGWDGWFKPVAGSCPKTKPAIVMVSCKQLNWVEGWEMTVHLNTCKVKSAADGKYV